MSSMEHDEYYGGSSSTGQISWTLQLFRAGTSMSKTQPVRPTQNICCNKFIISVIYHIRMFITTRSSSGDEISKHELFLRQHRTHTMKYNKLMHKFRYRHGPHNVYCKPETKHYKKKASQQQSET